MKKQTILWIALGVLTACNSPSGNKNSDSTKDINSQRVKLIGKWLQPIPGMESEKQGFELYENGVATSLNIHTLQYDKWMVSQDTLFLWYHTEGVQQVSNGVDTLIIKKLDVNNLVVSSAGTNTSDEDTYTKEK
ncbi:Lipocalin-like [Chryseobacterium rhizoplanae]|uniref:Lipocalin-like n=1 Tax=Chryseobacterium rhizoplanae TaxID=1609531 RepID=A0A521DMA4_9FLAO|nr:lipocalin family protein [Chryseobacterium rhizoplanae]SMO72853.1 Lipocalin-like [Chryseobacterium rhizoplanae]